MLSLPFAGFAQYPYLSCCTLIFLLYSARALWQKARHAVCESAGFHWVNLSHLSSLVVPNVRPRVSCVDSQQWGSNFATRGRRLSVLTQGFDGDTAFPLRRSFEGHVFAFLRFSYSVESPLWLACLRGPRPMVPRFVVTYILASFAGPTPIAVCCH